MSNGDDLRNVVDEYAERLLSEDLATHLGGAHLARYLFAAHWAADQSIADLCCGTGYGANLLLASGASRVKGFDKDHAAISAARERYPHDRLEYVEADVTDSLQLSEFGIRVCFEGLEHVQDPEALIHNLRQDLPQGGVAVVSTPNGAVHAGGHSGNPHHVHEYSLAEFKDALGRRFTNVSLYFQWRYGDPYDVRWNVQTLARSLVPLKLARSLVPVKLRSLVPVKLKHWLGRPPANTTAAAPGVGVRGPRAFAAEVRPYPVGMLRALPPGFRYGEPWIWIAVCRP